MANKRFITSAKANGVSPFGILRAMALLQEYASSSDLVEHRKASRGCGTMNVAM